MTPLTDAYLSDLIAECPEYDDAHRLATELTAWRKAGRDVIDTADTASIDTALTIRSLRFLLKDFAEHLRALLPPEPS